MVKLDNLKNMSPFRSKAQMRYMYANMPKLAAEWEAKYGVSKKLPNKVNNKLKKKIWQKKRKKK